ncbi:MAG TPA: FCD domain-containing protein [Solirubrobacteraceae bacterium]|jgi:DNA-binding FadR family transcriptional regulator|nr:FCD domain-containing protein [Solirubrobacteraceae bacterium]
MPKRETAPRPVKTSVLVAHRLARRAAELQPGDSLPAERALLRELGVGRSTLREALRMLELQGVLTIKAGPGGGPIVAQPDHGPLADTLSVALQATDSTVGELIKARSFLEAALARLAATAADEEDLSLLRASVQDLRGFLGDEERFLEENLRFHAACAAAAHNHILALFHASLEQISDGHVMGVTYGPRDRKTIVRAHERILEGIAARDPDRAASAMGAHMDAFQAHVALRYPGLLERPIRWNLAPR